jgi:hypothetical protein
MRKEGLLILLFLYSLILPVQAQVGEYRTDLAVGGSAGYMLSNVSFVPEVPQTMLGGLTGGLTLRYTCEKYFLSVCAIVAEVNIAQTGWKENIRDIDNQPVYYTWDTGQTDRLAYERRMTYLQVPFMARLGWGRERKGFQGFIQFGPQIGYCLGESTTTNLVKGASTQTARSSKIVAQDSIAVQRKFDYGIAVGGGIEWSHPKMGHFILEGRYYYGLGDIFDNTKSDYFGRSNFGQIVIKATYLFDIIRTKNPKIK